MRGGTMNTIKPSPPLLVGQCIMEGTWVHISFDPRMRGQFMNAKFDRNGKPTYSNR